MAVRFSDVVQHERETVCYLDDGAGLTAERDERIGIRKIGRAHV